MNTSLYSDVDRFDDEHCIGTFVYEYNIGRCESSVFLRVSVSFYAIISCMASKNKGFEDAVSINDFLCDYNFQC